MSLQSTEDTISHVIKQEPNLATTPMSTNAGAAIAHVATTTIPGLRIPDEIQSNDDLPACMPSTKRNLNGEGTPSPKKAKTLHTENKLSYTGEQVVPYVSGDKYNYAIHEEVPQLEFNSAHHKMAEGNFCHVIKQIVIPAIGPYAEEDDEIKSFLNFFIFHQEVTPPEPMRFAIVGESGTGKSATLNSILGVQNLSNSSSASASVTLVPQSFRSSTHTSTYRVRILVRHKGAIRLLLFECIGEAVSFAQVPEDEREEEENENIKANAEAAQEVLHDLFPEQSEFQSLEDIETFVRQEGLLDGTEVDSCANNLLQMTMRRLKSEGVSFGNREKIITAENAHDLRNKIRTFAERGGLASVASSIETQLHSPLLAQGIEIADVPGFTDTNTHLRKTAMDYLNNCPQAIVVANLQRAMTNPSLAYYLTTAVRTKGASNVWLLLRGKEDVEQHPPKCNTADKALLAKLEQRTGKLEQGANKASDAGLSEQEELSSLKEELSSLKEELSSLKEELVEQRLAIRNRIVTEHFQKKFSDRRGDGSLNVITISNLDYQHYMRGPDANQPPTLPHNRTGIDEVRRQLCKAPSEARVASFIRESKLMTRKLQRLRVSLNNAQLPRRDMVMSIFQTRAKMQVNRHRDAMNTAARKFQEETLKILASTWSDMIQRMVDGWSKTYAPRTQGTFFAKGGTHKPSMKGQPPPKKAVSWNEILLSKVENDIIQLEKALYGTLERQEVTIIEQMDTKVDDLEKELEQIDQIGGTDLDEVFKLFDDEKKACVEDITISCAELKAKIRTVIVGASSDDGREPKPAFVEAMSKIYQDAIITHAKGTKNLTKNRMEFLKAKVTASNGPFFRMAEEIVRQLKPCFQDWNNDLNSRIQEMFDEMRQTLVSGFDGKRMADERRAEIAPEILSAVEKAIDILGTDIKGYPSRSG